MFASVANITFNRTSICNIVSQNAHSTYCFSAAFQAMFASKPACFFLFMLFVFFVCDQISIHLKKRCGNVSQGRFCSVLPLGTRSPKVLKHGIVVANFIQTERDPSRNSSATQLLRGPTTQLRDLSSQHN